MNFDLEQLQTLSIETARAAGQHALTHYRRRREIDRSYPHDIKLVLDRECQTVAERCIRSRYPHHAILGEEGELDGQSELLWVVDPIDGTLNFSHGLPHWGVSVAVLDRAGRSLAGTVFLPMYEECYSARIDGPVTCNDAAITCSPACRLDQAMVLTGIRIPDPPAVPDLSRLSLLLQRAQKTRMLAAAAADLCWVACGRADAYVDEGLYLWDFAAGRLLVERAGGCLGTRPYQAMSHRYELMAATPAVYADLTALFPA